MSARGKILTVTESFSEFNSYNACNDSLMAKNQTCKLAVLKNISIWKEFSFLGKIFMLDHKSYVNVLASRLLMQAEELKTSLWQVVA